MSAVAFALTRPWGLHDPEGACRAPLRPEGLGDFPVGCGLRVVAPAGIELLAAGRRRIMAHSEGGRFHWNGDKQIWSLPLGAAPGEASFDLLIRATDRAPVPIPVALADAPIRPQQPGSATPDERLFTLLLAVVERIRSLADEETETGVEDSETVAHQARGRRHVASQVPWSLVERSWLARYDIDNVPPLDIIVRHAETLARIVEALTDHPRRILKRVRERLPLGRVQELDSACLEWYVRQPGRSAAEKAGSRRTILGVARKENLDTLENRVLRDYLARASAAAGSYAALHDALKTSARIQQVARYGRLCRLLERSLEEAGVGRPSGSVIPNYVLSHDSRYSRVWEAWKELLRREQEKDDIWRWQTRLWAEFVRISLQVAVRHLGARRIIAEVPMRVRADQQHGCWTEDPPHSAVVVIPVEGRLFAVTVIDALSPQAEEFGSDLWPYIWSAGPSCVLHAQDLESSEETWVLNWSLHPVDGRPLDLDAEARSADRALDALRRRIQADGHGEHRLRGVILASFSGADDAREGAAGETVAYSCPVNAQSLSGTLDALIGMIPVILGV